MSGFGNPEWANTHAPATSTAPAVVAVLEAGAKCVGKTVMDEMAYRFLFLFQTNHIYNVYMLCYTTN